MDYDKILSEFLIKDVSGIVYEYFNVPNINDLHESELIIWVNADDLKVGDIIVEDDIPYKISKITKKLYMYGTELEFKVKHNNNYTYTKTYDTKYISKKKKVKFNKNKTPYSSPCFFKFIYDGIFEEEYTY